MIARFTRVALVAVLLTAVAHPAAAQRALGIGDDASTLPAGMLRFTAGSLWDRANERYDADGKLRALGASASTPAWNGLYDTRLMLAAPLVKSLGGVSSFDASLGSLAIGRRDASSDGLFGIDLGLLKRLTVGARVRVASHGIEPNVALNPRLIEGTMGLNPAWTNTVAADRNAVIVAQFDSAVVQTTRRIAQCQAAPGGTGCTAITANVAAAQTIVANAASFATAMNALYGGRKNAAGLPFVPVSNSSAQKAIDQRVLGFRDQFVALGNSAIGTQGPTGGALFSAADITTLLADSLYGYYLRPLRTVHAYGLGEISVHLKARLFQTTGDDSSTIHGFAVRQSAGVTLRLNGGSTPQADEPFAPVTGDDGKGFTVQSFTDLFYGSRYSATVVVNFAQSQAQQYTMRLPTFEAPSVGGVPFPLLSADREATITRTPGSRIDIAVTPRVAMTPNIWLGASWMMSQQAADAWTNAAFVTTPTGVAAGPISAAEHWAAATDWTEQRLSLGGTYSTVNAAHAGKTKRAFDVTYEHQQTLSGSGWRVSHLSRDVVSVRWYPRAWGR